MEGDCSSSKYFEENSNNDSTQAAQFNKHASLIPSWIRKEFLVLLIMPVKF